MNLIIDCISDLHGHYPVLEGGDLLIVAGDMTCSDKVIEWAEFFAWLIKAPYRKKIIIGGNHDNFLESSCTREYAENELGISEEDLDYDYDYLCDSGIEFEGLKIWGMPWLEGFEGCNPQYSAFSLKSDEKLAKKCALIPTDVDILVTHAPPFGILDHVPDRFSGKLINTGSIPLFNELDRVKPRLLVFGHIHEHGGKSLIYKRPGWGMENNTLCVNAAQMDEAYRPVNVPVRVVL